jgi:hypothetical protein
MWENGKWRKEKGIGGYPGNVVGPACSASSRLGEAELAGAWKLNIRGFLLHLRWDYADSEDNNRKMIYIYMYIYIYVYIYVYIYMYIYMYIYIVHLGAFLYADAQTHSTTRTSGTRCSTRKPSATRVPPEPRASFGPPIPPSCEHPTITKLKNWIPANRCVERGERRARDLLAAGLPHRSERATMEGAWCRRWAIAATRCLECA